MAQVNFDEFAEPLVQGFEERNGSDYSSTASQRLASSTRNDLGNGNMRSGDISHQMSSSPEVDDSEDDGMATPTQLHDFVVPSDVNVAALEETLKVKLESIERVNKENLELSEELASIPIENSELGLVRDIEQIRDDGIRAESELGGKDLEIVEKPVDFPTEKETKSNSVSSSSQESAPRSQPRYGSHSGRDNDSGYAASIAPSELTLVHAASIAPSELTRGYATSVALSELTLVNTEGPETKSRFSRFNLGKIIADKRERRQTEARLEARRMSPKEKIMYRESISSSTFSSTYTRPIPQQDHFNGVTHSFGTEQEPKVVTGIPDTPRREREEEIRTPAAVPPCVSSALVSEMGVEKERRPYAPPAPSLGDTNARKRDKPVWENKRDVEMQLIRQDKKSLNYKGKNEFNDTDDDTLSKTSRKSPGSAIRESATTMTNDYKTPPLSAFQKASSRFDRFVRLLLDIDSFKLVCSQEITRTTPDQFQLKLHNLLKDFAEKLHQRARTTAQLNTANLLRHKARDTANKIRNELQPGQEKDHVRQIQNEGCDEEGPGKIDGLLVVEGVTEESKALGVHLEKLEEKWEAPSDTWPVYRKAGSILTGYMEEVSKIEHKLEEISFPVLLTRKQQEDYDLIFHQFERLLRSYDDILHAQRAQKRKNDKTLSQNSPPKEKRIETAKSTIWGMVIILMKSENSFQIWTPLQNMCCGLKRRNLKYYMTLIWSCLGRKPPVAAGKTRIEWRCRCGKNMYDDFTELYPGAAIKHKLLIDHTLGSNSPGGNSASGGISLVNLSTGNVQVQDILTGSNNPVLPNSTGRNQRSSHGLVYPQQQVAAHIEKVYLLLCISKGRYATRLVHLDLNVTSDEALFNSLRNTYKTIRGLWISHFSLRTLISIKFVHFELYRRELIGILKLDDIPPPGDKEYDYLPRPTDLKPPVGDNRMMHLFEHPEDAEDDSTCFSRFPKRLKERLECKNGVKPGWGLQFVEGWNMTMIWTLAFLIFVLGSVLLGVLWSVYGHSIQDAFAIASFLTGLATVTAGFVQALLIM